MLRSYSLSGFVEITSSTIYILYDKNLLLTYQDLGAFLDIKVTFYTKTFNMDPNFGMVSHRANIFHMTFVCFLWLDLLFGAKTKAICQVQAKI